MIDHAASAGVPLRGKSTEHGDLTANLLSSRVANAIREEILSGELEPGSRIRQEYLARRFEVSRIPVREALKQLESDGLVTLRANSGAWVSQLEPNEFMEIYKIRERLEPLALRESLSRLSADQINQLEELQEQMLRSSTVGTFLQLDRDFHLLTYAGANAKTLTDMIERFWNTTQHYRRLFTEKAGKEAKWVIHAEHRLLVEAIKRQDVEEGERILLSHIRKTRLQLSVGSEAQWADTEY